MVDDASDVFIVTDEAGEAEAIVSTLASAVALASGFFNLAFALTMITVPNMLMKVRTNSTSDPLFGCK